MGISKDKEAYEEWEAWEKHGASDRVGSAAATRADGGDGCCPGESLRMGAGREESGAAAAARAHARAHFVDRLSVK